MIMGRIERQKIKFGTDGWRAVIADNFTFENCELVAHAIGHYILDKFGKEKPVVVGYDCRFLADKFASLSANVFKDLGLNVLTIDSYQPTPTIANAAKDYDSAGALMFTASHNPPEYMGIKFIPEYAGPATADITEKIIANIRDYEANGIPDIAEGTVAGKIEIFDPYDRYVERLKDAIQFDVLKKANLKILYDPMYGAGLNFLDRIYHEETGHSMDMIHDSLDPSFGGTMPEPKEDHLSELIEKTPAGGYDLGLANDGDADRFGIVDEAGRFFSANQIIPLVFRYLHQKRGFRGAVVRSIATSNLVDAIAEKLGVTVYETPVGFKHLGEVMRREDIIIGGEESGGFSILNYIPEKDGILGDLLIAEMIAVEGKPLSEIYEDLVKEAGVRLHGVSINLDLENEKKASLMADMKKLKVGETFAGRPVKEVITKDGVKFVFGQYDWVLLRPSGTEPILRLYGESPDAQYPEQFKQAVMDLINKEPIHA